MAGSVLQNVSFEAAVVLPSLYMISMKQGTAEPCMYFPIALLRYRTRRRRLAFVI
jgi:hypothetical protein